MSYKRNFKKGDTPLEFLEKSKALMNAFRRTMPNETMYTYASYFGKLAPELDEQIEQLCELPMHFDSMEEWMDQFSITAYPNVTSHAVGELVKCQQEENESAIEYYNKAKALLRICGRTESSYMLEFVGGLKKSKDVRCHCNGKLRSCGTGYARNSYSRATSRQSVNSHQRSHQIEKCELNFDC